MKKEYLNKEFKTEKTQKIPRYVGQVELYWPAYRKITKPGDFLEELPIEEARKRSDFIIVERRR